MSMTMEQTTGNALLRCNIIVSIKKKRFKTKNNEEKKSAIVNIFTGDFYEALFLSSWFERILHLSCTFCCAVLHRSGCWDVRGTRLQRLPKTNKHETLFFSVTLHFLASVFLLVFFFYVFRFSSWFDKNNPCKYHKF